MGKANLIIAGDEIRAGIDMEDAEETGPIKLAVVIKFDTAEDMRAAMRVGVVEFDLFRSDA